MLHDHHESPPQECELCGIYKVYRDGLCWRCVQDAINAHKANQPREEDKDANRLSEDQTQ